MTGLHIISLEPLDFRFFQLSQEDGNNQEWKNARKDTITASLVPEMFGIGYRPWCRLVKGYEEPPSTASEYGKKHEQDAKNSYLQNYATFPLLSQTPGLLVKDIGKSFKLGCSMDLVTLDKDLKWLNVEFKCPFTKQLPGSKEKINPRYLVQVFVQMWVSGIKQSHLFFWTPTGQECYLLTWDPLSKAPSVTPDLQWLILQGVTSSLPYYLQKIGESRPKQNPTKKEFGLQLTNLLTEFSKINVVKINPN